MQMVGAPLRNVSAGLGKQLCRFPGVSPHMGTEVKWLVDH